MWFHERNKKDPTIIGECLNYFFFKKIFKNHGYIQ